MLRMRLEAYRLSAPIIGGGGSQVIGAVPLATLASGMSNGTQFFVKALVWLFDNPGATGSGAPYAEHLEIVMPILLTAGPTYTLGTASSSSVSLNGTGPVQTALSFSQSGGNLRLLVTPAGNNLDAYAVLESSAP